MSKKIKFAMDSRAIRTKNRVKKSLEGNFQYHHLALSRSKKFLRKHDSERLPMFVLYVDLIGSTKMSSDLSPDTLNVIIRTFSQEMAYVIEDFGGFVLKFVGDAVLAYFFDKENTDKKAEDVIECAKTMCNVIDNTINPILEEEGFPKIQIKVTIDFGDCSIVRYGADKFRSHIDIIGLTLNLAAKMQNYSQPNQIIIGKSIFTKLSSRTKKSFKKIKTDKKRWIFHQAKTKKPYSIYHNI
ncbi:Adenylate cyclase protein [Marine Group I thaumarchaeote SCGC AAA799-E16]|uniref:Adenylate cyclase protein n=3 Tax=Marine Group I TaxID=905826 RepID=A0A087S9B1_9ARCH|nr:Adenylate cyclase protein [Marine Group I thaumarchaeote SCGC AAA799-E16]KFM18424.1 adenylate cyclase protein [Marine Group I thaumarchaeote SCGC RSA3]KFM22315.1 Adenylate cyclase protein [Marine Group I thaumarchaeote SCGC AAA799-B03]